MAELVLRMLGDAEPEAREVVRRPLPEPAGQRAVREGRVRSGRPGVS
ncbi:hypothetical protein [Streptomyces sp. NPDC057336]